MVKDGGEGAKNFTESLKNLADRKKSNAETLKIIAETRKIDIEAEKAAFELQMLKIAAFRPTAEEVKKFLPVVLVAIYLASIAAHGVVPGIPAIGLFLCLLAAKKKRSLFKNGKDTFIPKSETLVEAY